MRRLILALLLLAQPAIAQDYPAPLTPHVSDYAEVLDAETEARITAALVAAREDPGTEIAVVTIGNRLDYGSSDSIESFATGLFNAWGIGDADRNDGILILVALTDRDMRLELGSGYPPVWNTVAEQVIDNSFLPAFRDGDYPAGIEAGTFATIDRIARPFAANRPPDTGTSWVGRLLDGPAPVIAIFAGFAALAFRRRIGDLAYRLRTCPRCGRRFLRRHRETLTSATADTQGQGAEIVTCGYCDYESRRTYMIPYRSRSSSGGSGFGGGSSSGGGASGRW